MTENSDRPADIKDPQTSRSASAVSGLIVVIAVALALLMVLPGFADRSSDTTAPEVPSNTAAATGDVTSVTVTVEGMSFSPAVIEVPVGNSLEVTFTNTGDQRHDLAFANGAATEPIAPGTSQVLDVGVIHQDMDGWCTLPGHRQMGMELQIIAVGADTNSHSSPSHAGHMADADTEVDVPTMDQLIKQAEQVDPHPAELGSAQESPKEFTFSVTEDADQLSQGVVRPLWTYNGTSPGPTLHGKVGDTFTITLKNEGSMGHSVDFHAGDIAPDEPMRTIEPGESLEYVFEAKRSGIWMYHCGTMPMSTHIANGMFGAVVIEPDELEQVDRSYVLLQSDIYLGEDSTSPALLAFNGRPFQYDAHPLAAKTGERVRVWLLDIGPDSALSFHIVGAQFDTAWTEGAYSVYRGRSTDGITKGTTGAQVMPLLAAQGGFVEFVTHQPGRYPFVNHIMTMAERGAHGIFEVTD